MSAAADEPLIAALRAAFAAHCQEYAAQLSPLTLRESLQVINKRSKA